MDMLQCPNIQYKKVDVQKWIRDYDNDINLDKRNALTRTLNKLLSKYEIGYLIRDFGHKI